MCPSCAPLLACLLSLLQLVAIDGEYYDPTAASPLHTIKTLLQSDNVSARARGEGLGGPLHRWCAA